MIDHWRKSSGSFYIKLLIYLPYNIAVIVLCTYPRKVKACPQKGLCKNINSIPT